MESKLISINNWIWVKNYLIPNIVIVGASYILFITHTFAEVTNIAKSIGVNII